MGEALLAPERPFRMPTGSTFVYYFDGSGAKTLAIICLFETVYLEFYVDSSLEGSGWEFELHPDSPYTFELPPSVIGFHVRRGGSLGATYIYFPGANH
jgi:hypothetical protein